MPARCVFPSSLVRSTRELSLYSSSEFEIFDSNPTFNFFRQMATGPASHFAGRGPKKTVVSCESINDAGSVKVCSRGIAYPKFKSVPIATLAPECATHNGLLGRLLGKTLHLIYFQKYPVEPELQI